MGDTVDHLVEKLNRASPLEKGHVRKNLLRLKRHMVNKIDKILAGLPEPKKKRHRKRKGPRRHR